MRCARPLVLLLALSLAGCFGSVDAPEPPPDPVEPLKEPEPPAEPEPPEGPEPPVPFTGQGRIWLPPSGQGRAESEVVFPVNASGFRVDVELVIGTTYGAPLPASSADVVAELRGPDGEVLAEASREAGGPDRLVLDAVALVAGEHRLVLLTFGGSGGGGDTMMGDHVDHAIRAG